MLGALGDPVDHLLFHHPILQPTHQLGIVAVQLNDLIGLFVGRGDQAQRLVQALGIQAQLVAARDLADQQAAEQARRQGQQVQVPDNAHEGFMDAARKRVLVGLLGGEVARRNQLRLDPKRLNETLRLIASTYEEPEQVIELYRNDPQLMNSLQGRVMEEQVIDWIAERAQHTEQALSFQEAIRN